MKLVYTPAQLAKRLNVSTTTLRRYEDQGLLPPVPRTGSQRRIYHEVHLRAFAAIRVLLKGYDFAVVYESMRRIRGGNATEALWLINRQLHGIQEEKQRVEAMMDMIGRADLTRYNDLKLPETMSIGEVAQIAGVNASAIRHWESEGLIRSERHPENGYRLFSPGELRKIIVISSLRKTVFAIELMRQLLQDLDTHSLTSVERSFRLALTRLNLRLKLQFEGIAALMSYLELCPEAQIHQENELEESELEEG